MPVRVKETAGTVLSSVNIPEARVAVIHKQRLSARRMTATRAGSCVDI
ncbi:hypothetical protein KL86SPO_30534 [uncultured Sporomusa sp.]|uniref:Uncharacterized protein n=1 Tax=uncultured Sporomusa sp. TaxID=307249 RepID=A0A212LS94_9FIRM|nr:hypothetical protein KL86SPO_30534 [uncultured Sporomusa sp.]